MRLFSLFLLLTLIAACGKESSNKSSANKGCVLNGSIVACESMQETDGEGVDLLESMVAVSAQISDGRIVFKEGKESKQEGRRISCQTSITAGESYQYSLVGDSLTLSTDEGNFDMQRRTGGSALLGTWVWKGYVDQGTHIIRTVTFLADNRVIIRKTCEL